MAITKLKKHNKCPVSARLVYHKADHHAEIRCERCDVWIQWLSKEVFASLPKKIKKLN